MTAFHVPGDLDLTEDESDLLICENADALQQQMSRGLQIFKGFYLYDLQEGILVIDGIATKNASASMQEQEIRDFLGTFESITSVDRITLRADRSTRILFVDYAVSTSFGPVVGLLPFLLT